jgi:hypothetical protein
MVSARLSLITYNLWLTERWPARAAALERFLKLFAPDVLCVQELQRPTQELGLSFTCFPAVCMAVCPWLSRSTQQS